MKEYLVTNTNIMGEDVEIITLKDENSTIWCIPQDPANKDYQAYLSWVAEGNKADVIEADK